MKPVSLIEIVNRAGKRAFSGEQISWFPPSIWLATYTKDTLSSDLIAALIVTIMLIPQSLAYAMLAGLPPEVGLYASIFPLLAYAIFGTSRTLAVGPVAVVSLLTASTIGAIAAQGTVDYLTAAILLAFISGLFLLLLGIFKLGFLANFLSHPVITGFINAAALIIATSQLKHLLGIEVSGRSFYDLVTSILSQLTQTNMITLALGAAVTGFLIWSRKGMKKLLIAKGIKPLLAAVISKAGPLIAVVITVFISATFGLEDYGVRIVGDIPVGLPSLNIPSFNPELWSTLVGPAILISIIGFMESISVAQTLAAKKRQRIIPNQELIGLGAANIASAFSGSYPVTGGFSRSVVNFDAGAETPAAGAFTAIGIAIAALLLTPLLYFLPVATLAAIIIVAVASLIDFSTMAQTWRYSRADFAAMLATIIITLLFGVEKGVMSGVALSIGVHLYNTSRPHVAIIGNVAGTEHFRNILRHEVSTSPRILSLRVDESLYFANARFLEDYIYDQVAKRPKLEHVILQCAAVNAIDASAFESIEEINRRLKDSGVQFSLSEIKGPVMDRLKRTEFFHHLTGKVYLSHYQAIKEIDPDSLK